MTAIDCLPSENPVQDRNSAFLRELDEFNRECLLLTQASQIITRTGEDLDRLLQSGTENLGGSDQKRYLETLKEFESFIAQFKKRVALQISREKTLKARARALGIQVDFHQLGFTNN